LSEVRLSHILAPKFQHQNHHHAFISTPKGHKKNPKFDNMNHKETHRKEKIQLKNNIEVSYPICKVKNVVLAAILFSTFSCSDSPESAQGNWIEGTEQEKIQIIEKQFRGFDNAMVETGYRYQELYWAGQDENWDYADYQLEKIRTAIENGLQRRPKRANSAAHFLNHTLPEMQKHISAKDTAVFNKGFQLFTNQCNNCHAMEKVQFFSVTTPTDRQSPIRK